MQDIIRLDLGTVNCYLLPVENGFILVDTGGYSFQGDPTDSKCDLLDKKLIENCCIPGKLLVVILTHGDVDHIANCKHLQEKYHVKILIHKDDLFLTHDLSVEKVLSNFKFKSLVFSMISKIMSYPIKKMTAKIVKLFKEFSVDGFIDENTNLLQYNLDAHIIHLPGHTKGSIGIITKDGNLISGDTFTNIKKPSIAMNAIDFSIMKESINRLKTNSIKTVYPGHGKPFLFSEWNN
jgi:hydroxyacylglutathione hydrolase